MSWVEFVQRDIYGKGDARLGFDLAISMHSPCFLMLASLDQVSWISSCFHNLLCPSKCHFSPSWWIWWRAIVVFHILFILKFSPSTGCMFDNEASDSKMLTWKKPVHESSNNFLIRKLNWIKAQICCSYNKNNKIELPEQ